MMAGRSRTRLDPDLRRELILAAATPIFRDQEFSAVSLDAVATEAGVTRGLIHHYFGSKRGLYLAVVEQAVRVPDTVQLVPAGTTGDLDQVLRACVASWMHMIEEAGGIWSGVAGAAGFAETDVDAVMERARDDLVDRMVDELPFPDTLDADQLRSALRCYAAFARVASDQWLVRGALTRDQTADLLHGTLLALAESVVPAMDAGARSR